MARSVTEFDAPAGKRAVLGKLCHRLGLLRPLQMVRGWSRQDLRILAYHRVLTVSDPQRFDFDLELISASAEDFRQQMQLVKRRFRPVPLRDAVRALLGQHSLPRDAVVITFDDGYDDNYRNAWPILRELGIPATFFVSTGHIDSGLPYAFDWFVHMLLRTDANTLSLPEAGIEAPIPESRHERWELAWQALKHLKPLDDEVTSTAFLRLQEEWNLPVVPHPDCRPMTWDQVREMHADGFEIGSHGVHHRVLARLPLTTLQAEVRDSRAAIERELGTPAATIAFPVGGYTAFDRDVIQVTRQAGYTAACTYLRGTNAPGAGSDVFHLRRMPVERYMDSAWFATMLTLPELMIYPNIIEPPAGVA